MTEQKMTNENKKLYIYALLLPLIAAALSFWGQFTSPLLGTLAGALILPAFSLVLFRQKKVSAALLLGVLYSLIPLLLAPSFGWALMQIVL